MSQRRSHCREEKFGIIEWTVIAGLVVSLATGEPSRHLFVTIVRALGLM